MNINVSSQPAVQASAATRLAVVDCDIHPIVNTQKELYPWLDKKWHAVIEQFGSPRRRGPQSGSIYTKSQPQAWRRDAWPEGGGNAGGSLELMQTQHLDANGIELGILNPSGGGSDIRHPQLSEAYCRAINEWQIETFVSKEPRLKASVVVPYNNAAVAAREIELRAGDPNFAHVLMYSRTGEPIGNQKYWPIYEAAEAAGLPIGVHAFGDHGYPVSSSGWPTYYFEEMFGHSPACQSVVTNLVLEGVLERFPKLKVIVIEGGVAWMASLMWRLDAHWSKLKAETPHLKRLPSEYIREQVWLTTQPIEEPEPRQHLLETIDWIGWDRICFSSDYPHWDFDDPRLAIPLARLTRDQREQYLRLNAYSVYGITPPEKKAAAA